MSQVPDRLPVGKAYGLWAGQYETESAVTSLERQAAAELTPRLSGVRLLDAGCGTGWRIADLDDRPALVVGVDLVRDMLALARQRRGDRFHLALADFRRLPLAAGIFDVLWCRLALSYVTDLASAYRELRRVAAGGARLVVTDFHPEATRAGHRRTFRDADGREREVAACTHEVPDHLAQAAAAGFRQLESHAYPVGPSVRALYQSAGRMDRYQRDLGLPLVLGLAFSC